MSHPRIAIIGVGDHARVIHELVMACGRDLAGFVEMGTGGQRLDAPILGRIDTPDDWAREDIEFTVAIGDNAVRAKAFEQCERIGLYPARLVHPTAIVLAGASIEPGAQICAGAIIGVAAQVGSNVIVNTAASIDHDGRIARHATVAPGAHLAGRVNVEEGAYVGIGAIVRQGLTIGPWALVAAGAVVVKDVAPEARVAGVPARRLAPSQQADVKRHDG